MSYSKSPLAHAQGDLTKAEWRSHINSSQEANLSLAEYCRQQNLIYSKFLYWKKKLSSKPSLSQSFALIKVKSPENPVVSHSNHVGSTSELPIRVWVKDICVDVGDNFLPVTLGKVIETLRRI